MKIATYSLLTLVFSVFILTPTLPKNNYDDNLKENVVIVYKEKRLERLIKSMEYQVTKDSLKIQTLRKNF
jgi:hypothetical protein